MIVKLSRFAGVSETAFTARINLCPSICLIDEHGMAIAKSSTSHFALLRASVSPWWIFWEGRR